MMADRKLSLSRLVGDAQLRGQFIRFAVTGGGSATTDLSVYALLARVLGVHPLIANLISRPMGGLFSFFVNRHWTFRSWGDSHYHVQFARFWGVWVLSFTVSESLVWLFHVVLHWGPMLSKVCAEGLAAIITFLLHRIWTFK